MSKKICILGATGSIGRSCLSVVAEQNGRYEVVGLAARRSAEKLLAAARSCSSNLICLGDPAFAGRLDGMSLNGIELRTGMESLEELAAHPDVDIVVNSMVGSADRRIDPPELSTTGAYKYDAAVDVQPEIADIDFKGLKLKKTLYSVDDASVERQLKMLQKKSPHPRASTTRPAVRAKIPPLYTAQCGTASLPASRKKAAGSAPQNRKKPCATIFGLPARTARKTSTPPSSPRMPTKSPAALAST